MAIEFARRLLDWLSRFVNTKIAQLRVRQLPDRDHRRNLDRINRMNTMQLFPQPESTANLVTNAVRLRVVFIARLFRQLSPGFGPVSCQMCRRLPILSVRFGPQTLIMTMTTTDELIYLDNNATTQLDPAVIEEILPVLYEVL